jgi:hypothetical protein
MGNTEVPVTYVVQPQGWATSGEAFDRIILFDLDLSILKMDNNQP